MRRPIAAVLVVVVMGGVVLPARGGLISGTIEGASRLTPTGPPGVFLQSFIGTGADTVLGAFTAGSLSIIDFSDPPEIFITNGSFLETFAQGILSGSSSGKGIASGAGTATVTIDIVFTGGTGAFAGATGKATLTGTLTRTSPTTQTISGTYEGTLSVIPEPSTLALLAPGAALGAMGAAYRRRKRARRGTGEPDADPSPVRPDPDDPRLGKPRP